LSKKCDKKRYKFNNYGNYNYKKINMKRKSFFHAIFVIYGIMYGFTKSAVVCFIMYFVLNTLGITLNYGAKFGLGTVCALLTIYFSLKKCFYSVSRKAERYALYSDVDIAYAIAGRICIILALFVIVGIGDVIYRLFFGNLL